MPTSDRIASCLFGGTLFFAGVVGAHPQFVTIPFEVIENFEGYITDIQPSDFNRDGAVDFMINSAVRGQGLRWYAGDPLRPLTFAYQPVNPNFEHTGIVVADLDADGDSDIAATSQGFYTYGESTIGWHANIDDATGRFSYNGSFDALDHIPGDFRRAGFSDIAAGDLDGDGDQDLATTGTGIDSVVWFENTRDRDHGHMAKHAIDASLVLDTWDENPGGHGSIKIAEVTNDRHPDVIVGGVGAITIYSSDGASPPSFLATAALGVRGSASIALADLNRDGNLDILYGTDDQFGSTGTLGILYNSGSNPPRFRRVQIAADGPYHGIHAGDINADGWPDFVVTRSRRTGLDPGSAVLWFENAGFFFNHHFVQNETNLQLRWALALFDLDHDGDLDVVTATRRQAPVLDARPIDEIRFHINLHRDGPRQSPINEPQRP